MTKKRVESTVKQVRTQLVPRHSSEQASKAPAHAKQNNSTVQVKQKQGKRSSRCRSLTGRQCKAELLQDWWGARCVPVGKREGQRDNKRSGEPGAAKTFVVKILDSQITSFPSIYGEKNETEGAKQETVHGAQRKWGGAKGNLIKKIKKRGGKKGWGGQPFLGGEDKGSSGYKKTEVFPTCPGTNRALFGNGIGNHPWDKNERMGGSH